MKTTGIAAQLFTLREFLKTPADIATTLKRVKAIGFDGVQLSGLGPIDPKELADILQGEGLTAAATHVSYDRMRNEMPRVIEEHLLWGCKNAAIGGMPMDFRNKDGYAAFAKIGEDFGRQFAKAGITFSYHNHSFEFERFEGKLGLETLYANSDPAFLKAEIDTYWVQHGGGDPAEWIYRVGGRMVIVHYKDMAFQDGKQIMAEVGEGNLNWPRIINACRETGVAWYAIEQDVCQRDPFESLAISLRNLRAMGVEK